ncbi:hypothetical protein [Sphingomonas glaciei]|uniref:Glycosyl transferase family 28 C-terminal domain-containing protein n=1 Tax=Sphingomonas glaciei TaxID=2938948 RepID=A0ABY5MWD0_9SPHN|nr:hypothetical protein [Sphingomonas glaciei]UUR08111.1 hypothetical protein M1K48_00210 [Sphingomonas glaciei]
MRNAIGYFIHHQGRGHAERAAAIVGALGPDTPVTLFSARDDIFPPLPAWARVQLLPSLFEAAGPTPEGLASARTPPTLHCAPLGWDQITDAVATLVRWFHEARPALFITDVSAELAQLARIASIPCVPVLQHGDRDDPGHMAAYEGAVGILAPYAAELEQPGRPPWMQDMIFHAGGLGVAPEALDKTAARAALGIDPDADLVLVIAGGGGEGTPAPPLSIGARAEPDSLWITIGAVTDAWHDTPPGNLQHRGWVDDASRWVAAADRIISSTGNTTVHTVAAAGRPWIVVPEWRYFDEQRWKARMLGEAGTAVFADGWPASAAAWSGLWEQARSLDLQKQKSLVDPHAAQRTAEWLRHLIARSWGEAPRSAPVLRAIAS